MRKYPIGKWTIRGLAVVVLVSAAVYGVPKALYYLSHEYTDDAFVEGTIVPVSSEVRGKVSEVFVENNQVVKEGEQLLEIEAEDYVGDVREKQETLAEAEAEDLRLQANMEVKTKELLQAKADATAMEASEKLSLKEKDRYANLRSKALVSQSQYEHIESRWIVDKARLDAARAAVSRIEAEQQSLKAQEKTQLSRINRAKVALHLAELNMRRTVVTAPISGRIAKKNVDRGKYVQPGQTLLAVVDEKDVWIVANFKETQLKGIRKDQPVDIRVDAYPGVLFKGRVDSIQPGTGAIFSLLPPENATGNFIKVVQRVAVKILLNEAPDPDHPLWPGLSVTPYVDTRR
ncbi:MAG: HlyD family secretion protein [Deltaproteobacteria bacterium]|nr:HlyD family secretion protein [Deltaproteobacteria bacterium]